MTDTGLKQREVINHVVDLVWRIRMGWLADSASPQKRMQALVACVFKGLDMLSIPHPEVRYNPNMSPTLAGEYGGEGGWTLELNPSYATAELVGREGEQALSGCLGTVYHETRHHEQHFRARYYLITAGKSWVNFKRNLEILSENKKAGFTDDPPPATMISQQFKIPLKYAEAFWGMFKSRFQYQGTEMEEAKKWYEEWFGAHKGERDQIMQSSSQFQNRRDSFYALYRTVFMEDDAWETGYNAGDAYLARSFNDRKESRAETIKMWEGKLTSLKERQTANQNYLNRSVAEYRSKGGQALRNKIKQTHEELKLDEKRIQAVENKINGEKTLLAGDKSATQSLIKKHRESMTFHRVNAYDKRLRRGIYLGTASQGGSKHI